MGETRRIPVGAYVSLLRDYLRPQWRRVVILALLLFANIALQVTLPQILRSFIDTAQDATRAQSLMLAAVFFIGVSLAREAVFGVAIYIGEGVGWNATNRLRVDLLRHCLSLDQSWHKAHPPGELIERLDGDTTVLSNFFYMVTIFVIGNALLLLVILVVLGVQDWRMGAAFAAFSALTLGLLIRIRRVAVPFLIKVREMSATFYGFLSEWLLGTEDIRANGATGFVLRRFTELKRTWLRAELRSWLAGYSMWASNLAVFAAGTALSYLFGAYLWRRGAVTIGGVYLIVQYVALIQLPIMQIRFQIDYLQRADASISRIQDLLETHSRISPGRGLRLPAGPIGVEMKGVKFSYESGPLVLDSVDLDLRPGRVLGLLGRTGSGKTTLARLLLRLYDANEGNLRLSGLPIRDIAPSEVRSHVGLVTQEVQLFHATLRDNLTFFTKGIGDAQIVAVLRGLGLGRVLDAQPNGLDTVISAGSFSAGEAQLLAFARVFLTDPGLVILDEASSRLDPATEAMIQEAIGALLCHRSAIIIAHRLSTISRADDILVLSAGKVIESGDRLRLLADPQSEFSKMLAAGVGGLLQ